MDNASCSYAYNFPKKNSEQYAELTSYTTALEVLLSDGWRRASMSVLLFIVRVEDCMW